MSLRTERPPGYHTRSLTASTHNVGSVATRAWTSTNHVIISVFHLVLLLLARRRYQGLERIPASGGALVVSNHVSHLDPLTLSHAVRRAGRNPLGMGKIELFRIPVIGWWFAKIGHVSVDRSAPTAAAALGPAAEALREGKVLCMYPEGTVNAAPEQGLLAGKTGVARLALAAGVPVVPVGQWGPQLALSASGRVAALRPPRLFGWLRTHRVPRRPVCELLVGEPLTPLDLRTAAGSLDEPDYRAVTDLVMTRIGALVAELSGIPDTARLGAGRPVRSAGHNMH